MKTLNTLRYILFSILILGCFANFAQNEYGMKMVNQCTMLIGLGWVLNLLVLGKEQWKNKFISELLLVTFSAFLLFLTMLFYSDDDFYGFGMLLLLIVFVIELLVVAILNRKQHANGSFQAWESFFLFMLFAGMSFKTMHWPGASMLIILGGGSLILTYFIHAFKTLFVEVRNGKLSALFSFLVYLSVILGVTASVFKNQHWPGAALMNIPVITLLVFFLIFMVLNIKLKQGDDKVSPIKLFSTKGAVLVFMFVYLNYWALFLTLQSLGVGPKFYSLAKPPALEKIREESKGEYTQQIQDYEENYYNFLMNRGNAQNSNK